MNQTETVIEMIRVSHENEMNQLNQKKSQELYVKYYLENDELDFNKMFEKYQAMNIKHVRIILGKNYVYSKENEEDSLSSAKVAIYKDILTDRENGLIPRENYFARVESIFENKTMDVVKKNVTEKIKIRELTDQAKNGAGGYLLTEDYSRTKQLICMYCELFMNYTKNPVSPLAVCYTRVMPHLVDDIGNRKGSSNWAFENMKGKSFIQLTMQSQEAIHRNIDKDISWCEEYYAELEKERKLKDNKSYIPKNTVLTNVCTKEMISDRSEYMHKYILTSILNRALKDSDLYDDMKILGLRYMEQKGNGQ